MLRRRALVAVWVLALLAGALALHLPSSATAYYPVDSVDTPESAGAYIIDMGVVPQTVGNGLRPYGLVYDLTVDHQIPVYWAINDTKAREGIDFTVPSVNGGGAKSYRGGSFVVPAEYALEAQPIINSWKTANPTMVVDRATADFVLPHFETITSWPNASLDEQNGGIAEDYYQMAGIPAAAYNWVDPSLPYNSPELPFPATDRLGRCVDIYVMPHADPTWATHRYLVNFNNDGGYIWAACHAVSVLENIADPLDPDPDPDMNFLSVAGLVPYGSHDDGTPPYDYAATGWDPLLQFMGVLDGATQNGSEQIYLPKAGGWRPTTSVLVWDPDQKNIPSLSPGAAAVAAYGRGFGLPGNGLVMYEAGHTHTKGTTTAIVAAIRAFLNLHLLAGIERGVDVSVDVPNPVVRGTAVPVSATASKGSLGYTYQWSSSCGGTFDDPAAAATVFHAPAQTGSCSLKVVVHDGCGRISFGADTTVIVEAPPQPQVTKTPSPVALAEPGGTVTFTIAVHNPATTPITLTALSDDVFGDLRDAGNVAVSNNTCPAQPAAIPAGGNFGCAFDAVILGNGGDPAHRDTVTVTAQNAAGQSGTGSATAVVPFTDVPPAVAVVKTASAASVPEPGAVVTFGVAVENLSVEQATLTSLLDNVFGDLRDPANPAVANNTCPAQSAVIPVYGTLSCSFEAFVAGDAGDPDHVDTVTASVLDDEGNAASAGDSAAVGFDDVLPLISVAKTPSRDAVPQPGEAVTFTVEVANHSAEAVTLTSLVDDLFGDLRDIENPSPAANTCPMQAAIIPVGGIFACSFEAFVAGDASDPAHVDTVTATAVDNEGNVTSGSDNAVVGFVDVLPAIFVAKTPSPASVPEPGGTVTFTVEVENLSVETVSLVSLEDDVFGDLRFAGNPAVANNTCPSLPAVIPLGAGLTCSFQAFVGGNGSGPPHHNTLTAAVQDGDGNLASADDDATVVFSDVLPSVSVAKVPSAGFVAEPGGTVTFSVEVDNTTVEPVDLTSLIDDVFGDLLDPANPAVSNNNCPVQPRSIPVYGTLACSFEAYLAGNAGDPSHVDTVTVAVSDDEGNVAGDADSATVSFWNTAPAIDVHKGVTPGSLPEPGGAATFDLAVSNLSVEAVTLTSLSDDTFGDLLDPANPAVAANTCPAQPAVIPVGGAFSCSFEAELVGDAAGPDHRNRVTAAVVDDEGSSATGSDDAVVSFTDVHPIISTTKTPATGLVPEPGAAVAFAVAVENMTAEAATVWSLADSVFGDLLDPANPAVARNTCPAQALALPAGGTFSCSFEGFVGGGFGDPDHVDTVTAGVRDNDGNLAFDADEATIAFSDVLPALSVTKSASVGSVPEPGATVTFTVGVTNLSVEAVTVAALMDDVFGDLLDPANLLVSGNTCPAQPPAIAVDGTFTCSFEAFVAGDAGDPDHVDTVTVAVADDDGNLVSGSDEAAVAFGDARPVISAVKSPSAGSVPEPGATVTFTVEVANASVEPVTLLSLDDDVFGDLLDPANPLVTANGCPGRPRLIPAGGLFACSFEALVAGHAGDPDHRNTVTAAAADDEGNPASAAAEAVVGFADVLPMLAVAKTPSAGAVREPGAVVTFAVQITNTSVEPVTLTSLVDDVFGDLRFAGNPAVAANTCPARPAAIPAGGVLSCSFDALVAGRAGDPEHHNTVAAAVTDDEGNTAADDDDAVVLFQQGVPTIDVTKEARPGTVAEPGAVVTFAVEVVNTSAEPLTVTSLVDDAYGNLLDPANPLLAGNTCPAEDTHLPTGSTFACSFAALVAGHAGDPSHRNTVTAVAFDGYGNSAADADHAVVSFSDVLPMISVGKSPTPSSVPEPGSAVTFSVLVENRSVEGVRLTSLVDDVFGNLLDRNNPAVSSNTCPSHSATLPRASEFACSFRAVVSGEAGGPDHVDTITAAAVDDEGNPASAAATARVSFSDVAPAIAVSKTPSAGSVPEPGGPVTFGVTVANASVEPVTLTSLVDDQFGDLLAPSNPAVSSNTCPAQPVVIPQGGSFACSFEAWLAGAAGGPGHRNTVSAAAADDDGNTALGSDQAAVAFGDTMPTIEVGKAASPGTVPEPGGMVTFTVEVVNTSVEPVTLTSLTDDHFGDLLDPDNPAVTANNCPQQPATVPAGGTLACAFAAFVGGDAGDPDHRNTVAAVVVDDEGNQAVGTGDAAVAFADVLPGVAVAKSADPSAVDQPGGIVLFSVEVTNTAVEPVTLVTLTDSVFGDLLDAANGALFANTCPAQPGEVPAGGTLRCSFEALVEGEHGDPDHVNTITAVVADDEGNPASAADSAAVSFLETEAMVTGHLFVDLDGDGVQGLGEPHLAGVRVRLVDGAGHRSTVTSDVLGNWEAAVQAGVVSMRVVAATLPAGYRLTTANASQTVDALPGSTVATADVGYQPADGSLAGKVFFDVDGNGEQWPGEPSFAGVAVALYQGDRLLQTVVTPADGSYGFDGLAAGEHRVVVRDDTDFFGGFSPSMDPDTVLDGETRATLGTSEVRRGVDFAYRGTGSVGDTVWEDADGDGVQDPGEQPLSGIVVGLVWAGFDGVLGSSDDVAFPAEITGPDGIYLFDGVPAGVVEVAVDPASVGDDFEATTATSYTYQLGPGVSFLDGDIGFRAVEELPYTGFDADRLGFLSLSLIALGFVLLLVGRRGKRDSRLRWERLG